jgi:hypothetical protein
MINQLNLCAIEKIGAKIKAKFEAKRLFVCNIVMTFCNVLQGAKLHARSGRDAPSKKITARIQQITAHGLQAGSGLVFGAAAPSPGAATLQSLPQAGTWI